MSVRWARRWSWRHEPIGWPMKARRTARCGGFAIGGIDVDQRSMTPSRKSLIGSDAPQGMSENDTSDCATFRKNEIVSRDVVVDADADGARCGSLRHGARQANGLVVAGHDVLHGFDEERAFGGERRAGARAVEHLEAQLVFDDLQLVGEGGLRDVQFLRGGRHRLALGKYEHHAHLRYVHAFTSSSPFR